MLIRLDPIQKVLLSKCYPCTREMKNSKVILNFLFPSYNESLSQKQYYVEIINLLSCRLRI